MVPIAAIITFILIDANGNQRRMTSLLGVIVFIMFGFVFSKYPSQVNWRTVVSGIVLQYIFALLSIRWETGRNILQCIGDKITQFLEFAYVGAAMVYGDFIVYDKAVFAFKVLSAIYFFGFIISMLYYYGAMQWVIIKIGTALQFVMGTTACESINTSSSVFIGMTEAPLLIKPYIALLTKSEMHSIMTGCLSTVAGTVMAAYISFGISPAHLITASIMSAPAALCYSKLLYPETEKSKTASQNITMDKGSESNVLDAAASGAISAIELIAGIIANLVAFVSFIAFLNAIVSWFGGLVGVGYISFEWILGKVFIPLAWLLGVAPDECEEVALLMGLKTIVNEFVAYQKLSGLMKAGKLTKRASTLATYALCGFSNPGSVGILVGSLSAMAPDRKSTITEVALRSFVGGCITCFLTACV
ncbi:hypothetical protein J437_LFUL005032, partial [Ladona fulva]